MLVLVNHCALLIEAVNLVEEPDDAGLGAPPRVTDRVEERRCLLHAVDGLISGDGNRKIQHLSSTPNTATTTIPRPPPPQPPYHGRHHPRKTPPTARNAKLNSMIELYLMAHAHDVAPDEAAVWLDLAIFKRPHALLLLPVASI